MNVGSLVFQESATLHNRYALVTLDASVDKLWTVNINGSDNNGDLVRPQFIVIDNYSNENALSYSIDGLNSGLAPYTSTTLQVGEDVNQISFALTDGITNLMISEKRLPVTEGTKYQQGTSTPPVTGTQTKILLAGTLTFVVPATWNSSNNSIHCYGCGATGAIGSGASSGGDGGGAGSYARKNNVILAPGSTQNCQIGTGGSGLDTWAITATTVKGLGCNTGTGSAALGIGDATVRGGNGGKASGAAAGGGGGGPGISVAGANVPAAQIQGGNSGDGKVGGAGGANGADGDNFTDSVSAAKAGGGSGGSGSIVNGTQGGNGGKYGAGGGGGKAAGGAGGLGGDGVIILVWTP